MRVEPTETRTGTAGCGAMEMPDLKPIQPPRQGSKRLILFGVAAFMVPAFVFAMMANIPEWR
jgi:hypothetical protein